MHDLRLVLLAGLLCVFACSTAMTMLARARANSGIVSLYWAAGGGLVSGCGIWGMHFVAMLAFNPGFAISYHIGPTIVSVLIAIALSAAGFAIAITPSSKNINAPLLGGTVIGLAVAAMHFIGMTAMAVPADMQWDHVANFSSNMVGVALIALAFWIALRGNSRGLYAVGAGLFALAICAMHFMGMSAVTFHFNPTISVANAIVSPFSLAVAVTACASLIVALGCVGAVIDYHLAERNRGEQLRLRAHVAELQATKTNLEAAGKKLKIALSAAASASQAKSAFLASMSHELRTPLNAIIGFSEVMQVETFGPLGTPRYKEYAGDIHDSGKHLLELINDILDLSRLDAGAMTLHEEDFDLRDVMALGFKMISRQAENRQVKLMEDFPAYLPPVHADQRRIKQVLINLLANAIKFTPPGGSITLKAWVHDTGLSVSVRDTGIGIAPENIAKALEPFSQIDASLSREHGGAGLGLPLSNQLMLVHGGSLTLESKVAVGTTVTITLPASRVVVRRALSAAE